MLKAIRLSAAACLALALTGCSTIRYAVNGDSVPVAFSATRGGAASRPIKVESRSYFGGLGFLTYNDYLAGLGTPMKGVSPQHVTKRTVSASSIVEEYTPIDFGLGLVVSVLGNAVTGGLASILYSGSRTSTITAQTEEKAK